MGYEGFAAKLAEVLDEPAYLSEDVALPEAIDGMIKKDPEHSNLYVFDRGLSSLRAYDSMTEQHARFVGRIKTNRSMETVRVLEIPEADKCAPEKLVLDEDKAVHLREGGSRKFGTEEYRVITAHFKEPRDTTRPQNKGKAKRVENRICFITNDMELPAKERLHSRSGNGRLCDGTCLGDGCRKSRDTARKPKRETQASGSKWINVLDLPTTHDLQSGVSKESDL